MPDLVAQPNLGECCSAVVGTLRGLLRPRPPDRRFLRSIADAGLPAARGTVSVRALPQVVRPIPAAVTAEGVFAPRQVGNALTSFVIEHPRARFVAEPGVCLDVDRRVIPQLPAVVRPILRPRPRPVPTVTALEQEGIGPLDFALPTHAHWDHVSGLLDLPRLPVHLHRAEHEWIGAGELAPAGGVRDALRNRSIVEYDLDGPPVLSFAASHDLFGDGAVVLVDLAGHTPGSVGILAHTAGGWLLLAGDAAWHGLQIERIRQKASFPGKFVDHNRDETLRTLHRLHLARTTVTVIPTHDHAAVQPLRRHRQNQPSHPDP